MSFHALSWAIKQKTESSTSKLVLLVIANYCDKDNQAYPSQEHLALVCHCTRKTVNTQIKKLEAKGLIKVSKKSNGSKVYNIYTLQCEKFTHNTNIRNPREDSFTRRKRNKNFLAG